MIKIPKKFLKIPYNAKQYPKGIKPVDLLKGVNCQLFVYELLRYNGFDIPFHYRSSNLWEDAKHTEYVDVLEPFDILFFNKTSNPYGAHLGIYISPNKIVHLSKIVGYPAVWSMDDFKMYPQYQTFLGAKRLKKPITIKLVIFDWKRTLYDPDSEKLVTEALDLLNIINNKQISMVLIGKGGEDMQQEVDRLGVRKYFQQIIFAEGDKNPESFLPFISKNNPKETVFIGDRVRSELLIGNKLGATTIWVKQGKFASEEPESEELKPGYTVLSLTDCLKIISV